MSIRHIASKVFTIVNETEVIVESKSIIYLPKKNIEMRRIGITNVSPVEILIISKSSLIYNHRFAPTGLQQISILPNKRCDFIYIGNTSGQPKWFVDIY